LKPELLRPSDLNEGLLPPRAVRSVRGENSPRDERSVRLPKLRFSSPNERSSRKLGRLSAEKLGLNDERFVSVGLPPRVGRPSLSASRRGRGLRSIFSADDVRVRLSREKRDNADDESCVNFFIFFIC
jgi:hypothetical protein